MFCFFFNFFLITCNIRATGSETALSGCWDGLSMTEVSDILEDITVCVPKTAEACKGAVPGMLEGVFG